MLGVSLGPLAETSFMTTMVSFNNDWTVFFTRPVSGVLMTMACIALVYPVALIVKILIAKVLGSL